MDDSAAGFRMTKILAILAASLLWPVWAARAQTWTGILVDLSCHESNPNDRCAANSFTTRFGVQTQDGRVYPLAPASASAVQQALQGQMGDVSVTVSGPMEAGAIKAESVARAGVAPAPPVAVPQPQPPPQPAATPKPAEPCMNFSVHMPDGKVYKLDVPLTARMRTEQRSRAKSRPPRITISGAIEGATIRVDDITISK